MASGTARHESTVRTTPSARCALSVDDYASETWLITSSRLLTGGWYTVEKPTSGRYAIDATATSNGWRPRLENPAR
jgi:hypothetical protein